MTDRSIFDTEYISGINECKIYTWVNSALMDITTTSNSCFDAQDIKINHVDNKTNILITGMIIITAYLAYKR